MGKTWKAKLVSDFYLDRQSLFVYRGDDFISSVNITMVEKGNLRPSMFSENIDDGSITDFLQAIMDEAWRIGLKPSGYEDANRELSATKGWLEDMRKLAGVKS